MNARLGVSLCGAIALVVLVRAAAYYARVDALALSLVLAMTVALVASLAELLQRVSRAEKLTRELAALPRQATLATIEGASAELRPVLLSRVAGTGAAVAGAPLAGYVVGLLVMFGLLGTFLGLFETLRGAREALTSSGDVETLRASLAAPMQGLTRSFGTSAAGVSASSMLGLAVALARRVESRFAVALSAYAASALVPLTVQGRQLDALHRLARQGEALPRVVATLEETGARLGSLQSSWSDAHAKSTERTSAAIRDAVDALKADLERAITRSAAAAEQALGPLVARAVEGSVAVARDHVTSIGERLATDLEARRADDAASVRTRDEAFARLTAIEEDRAKKLERTSLEMSETARAAIDATRAQLAEVSERATANATQLGALAKAVEARGEATAVAAREQHAAVDALLVGVAARAEAFDTQARSGHASLLAEVQRRAEEQASRALTLEQEVGAALATQAERLVAAMGTHTTAIDARFTEVAASVRDAAAGVQAGGGELVAVAEMFAGAVDRHREGAAEWLAGLGTIEGAIARAADVDAGGALAEQLDRARELYDTQLQFHRELLLQLRAVSVAVEPRHDRSEPRTKDEDAPA